VSRTDGRGHAHDRNYIITHDWLGQWQGTCDRCGELSGNGPLVAVFALLWKHRKCQESEATS